MECEVVMASSIASNILNEKLKDNVLSTHGSFEPTRLTQVFKFTKYFSQGKAVFKLLLTSQLALTYANI